MADVDPSNSPTGNGDVSAMHLWTIAFKTRSGPREVAVWAADPRLAVEEGKVLWKERQMGAEPAVIRVERHQASPYAFFQRKAYCIKIYLQMLVGLATAALVVYRLTELANLSDSSIHAIIPQIFTAVSLGLGVAAAIELTYTLFTPGPDEAIEPLTLGVSAAALFLVSQLDHESKLSGYIGVILLIFGIATLFIIRRHLFDQE